MDLVTELITRERVLLFGVQEDCEFGSSTTSPQVVTRSRFALMCVVHATSFRFLSAASQILVVGLFGTRGHTTDIEDPCQLGDFVIGFNSINTYLGRLNISRAAHTLSASRRASRSPFGYVLVEVRPACRRVLALCDAFHLG